MRLKLIESMESIKRHNLELERRVAERTSELQRNKKRLANLLEEVMNVQEEKRKRVARELHDETSQSLAALGMSIEMASIALRENRLSIEDIAELKKKVDQVIDGINRLIRDLRPPVLDDLGLESAVKWLLERHLRGKDITYYLTATDEFKQTMSSCVRPLPAGRKTELMLFRIIQEAIINIAKHAHASNVFVHLDSTDSYIQILIEDDGVGFDVQSIFRNIDKGENVGFGILGMKERVALLDGRMNICSTPGSGTSITVDVPWNSLEIKDA